MTKKDKSLDLPILNAARQEFKAKGYQGASLRSIAKKSNVTTGAIYTRFESKEQLFHSLVRETVDDFFTMYDKMFDEFEKLSQEEKRQYLLRENEGTAGDELGEMIDFLYERCDELILLMVCSPGSAYEDFSKQLIDKEVKMIVSYLEGIEYLSQGEREGYKMTVRMIITSHFTGLVEIFRQDISKEELVACVRDAEEFYQVGWRHFFRKVAEIHVPDIT